jgi:hypothetical protein
MSSAEIGSLAFFGYCTLAGRFKPATLAGSLMGGVLVLLWTASDGSVLMHDWILPLLVLLAAYWTSGTLFRAAMPRVERALEGIDRFFAVGAIARRAPRIIAELLELAYVGVYPLIPVALIIHLTLTPGPDVDRFWTVILFTDYVCFGFLAWIQTRPPRRLQGDAPWEATVRRLNTALLGAASIGVNTFPSGHAAEALAAALLVMEAPAAVAWWMFANAFAIAAGAVLGRYHYLADAVAGYVVAVVVYVAIA